MDGCRRVPVAGAEESKLEPSPVKEEEGESVEPTPAMVKKEDLSDVPCKVPKFQYVDFPSLHQCIQQLAIPPLGSWLAGCPGGRPAGMASRSPAERVPKFKYVDYPSLHHCIKQLSVPPLESWSLGPPGSVSSGEGVRPRTGSPAPPVGQNKERTGQRGSQVSDRKRDRDAVLPGPSPGPVQKGAAPDATSCKPQRTACVGAPPEAEPPAGSGRGQPRAETASEDRGSRRSFSRTSRPGSRAPDRLAAPLKASERRTPRANGMLLDLEPEQARPRLRPEITDPLVCEQSFWGTVTESVCPFCQKMLKDPEELRVHQRSHRDKKPH